MTPERMAAVVARWVRRYTRGLPPDVARRRVGELDADLHDHVAHERAHGTGDRRIALGIAARMLRGLAADLSWRARANPTTKDPTTLRSTLRRPGVRPALVTAAVLLVPLVAMLIGDDGTAWSVADFVFAAVLLGGTGLLLELAARRPRELLPRVAAAAIGVAAIALGEADDAPGLVLFGLLLIGGAIALTVRTARRS